MAGNLPQAGVQLTAQGAAQFFSQMSQADRAVAAFASQTQASAAKVEKLSNTLDLQRKSLAILEKELDAVKQKYGESSIQAQKKQLAVDKLNNSISENEKDLEAAKKAAQQTAPAIDKLGDEVQQTGTQFETASKGINVFQEMAIGALRKVGELGVQALQAAGRAAAAFVTDAVKSAGDFQQGLNMLQAVTGATNEQMKAIHDEAIALGNDMSLPATSARDAADAMTELAKAGLSVQDSMDAAKGTLQLATAAETDAGNAAQIVAGALNAFHLKGTDATKVADLLAAAANANSASMTDLAQGLQQGGFLFNATGQKIDDLTASLAILTNVGLTGSDAGTALKNAMTRLINPTDAAASAMESLGINVYDSNGKMLPFRDIIGVLNKALAGLTDQERNGVLSTIFLSDGMKAMIPLLDAGVTGFDAMKAKVNEAGAAQSLAGSQMKGFNGAIAAVTNAVDTLKLVIGEQLLPLLTPLINQIADGVSKVGAFAQTFFKLVPAIMASNNPLQTFYNALRVAAPSMQGLIDKVEAVTDWLSDKLSKAIAFVSDHWDAFKGALEGVGAVLGGALVLGALSAVGAALSALLSPIALVIAAAALLGAAWETDFGGIRTSLTAFWESTAKPILANLAEWLGKNIPVALEILAGFWTDTLQPALALVWGFLKQSVFPILSDLVKVYIAAAIIEVRALAEIWSTVLWPALKLVWSFIADTLIPIIAALVNVNIAILQKVTEALAGLWQKVLHPALKAVGDYVSATLGPILREIGDWLDRTFGPILQDVARWLGSVTGGFNGISSAVQKVIRWVNDFADKVRNLKLPDWLTPGSPTPLEMGLRGITSALQELLAQPDPFEVMGEHAGDVLSTIQDIAGEVQKVYQDMASMARQTVSNLQAMGQLDQGRIYANQKLAEIMKQANEIAQTDPEKAKAFYQMASQHVIEEAQLYDERRKAQQELAAAQAAMQHTAADLASFTPEQYAAEQERLRLAQEHLDILNQQYDAVQEAQRLERQAFQAGYTAPQTTGLANVAEALRQILTAKGVPGILNDPSGVVQMLYNLVTALQGITHRATGGPVSRGAPYLVGERGPELFMPWMNGLVSPLASPAQIAGPSYTTNSSSTVNYSPTYAQPPGSPAYDLAILGAFGV